MYHSIQFGDRNTWDDWHLIPTSRPVFNPPPVKTSIIDIPGGDGVLDLTTALTGRPTYSNRTGSFEFIVQNGFRDWTLLYSEISTYLHGQSLRAVLADDDPGYYYEGRFSVNAWKSDPHYSKIVIDYNVGPYKRSVQGTTELWLWDPFNFETGVIRYYESLPVNGELSLTVIGDAMPVIPTIITSASGITVEFNGVTYALSKGANFIREIVLSEGENVFLFRGTGIVSVDYEGGSL